MALRRVMRQREGGSGAVKVRVTFLSAGLGESESCGLEEATMFSSSSMLSSAVSTTARRYSPLGGVPLICMYLTRVWDIVVDWIVAAFLIFHGWLGD